MVTAYETGEIDRAEVQRRLAEVLASYRSIANDLQSVDAPDTPGAAYMDGVNTLWNSTSALSQALDDGDEARVAAALAGSLQATARMYALVDGALPAKD